MIPSPDGRKHPVAMVTRQVAFVRKRAGIDDRPAEVRAMSEIVAELTGQAEVVVMN